MCGDVIAMIHTNTADRELTLRIVEDAISAWANRDLERTLSYMHEDVVHRLNVNSETVPFGGSTFGKAALRQKLQLLLDTFEFGAFVTEHAKVDETVVRVRIKIIYIHFLTGERLNVRFRFVITHHDGLITRIEELHDAAYVEAFMRLVATQKTQ
jgi:ketosteroid isomerase-like protein